MTQAVRTSSPATGDYRLSASATNANTALVTGSPGTPMASLSPSCVVSRPTTFAEIPAVWRTAARRRACALVSGLPAIWRIRKGGIPLPGVVGHGGEVLLLLRVVAEFLAVTVVWQWEIVDAKTSFGDFDDRGDVEGVGVDGDAPVDRVNEMPSDLRYPRPCRGSRRADRPPNGPRRGPVRIAAVGRNVLMDPAERFGNVSVRVAMSTVGTDGN